MEEEGFEEEFCGDFFDFLDDDDGDFAAGSITSLVIFFLDLHMKESEAFREKKKKKTEWGCGDG